VKSFASEQRELTALAKAANRLQWSYVKDADVRATWAPAMENLPRMGLALNLFVGGILAVHNPSLIGTIVAFNGYMLMFQPPFRQLGMVIMLGQRAKTSSQRIFEILDQEPTIVDASNATDLTECHGDVVFEDVTFGYNDESTVLEHFDLHLAAGETLVLVGRTGTGKSTVARLINRSYDTTSGSIKIDGRDVRDLTLRSLRHNVGIVVDEPFLFSDSVRANIAYGRPDASIEEVEEAARAAGADRFISRLSDGYETVVGERGYTLSGGQRQRIAIARTLLMNPPVLVLDDATSAIDVQVEQRIHAQLKRLMEHRTTLIIAHRLSTISLADRVGLLEDGHLVALGTHAELLAKEPRYSEVLAQVQALEEESDLIEDEIESASEVN
jgi:ATP-binding cassette subfamily B protein